MRGAGAVTFFELQSLTHLQSPVSTFLSCSCNITTMFSQIRNEGETNIVDQHIIQVKLPKQARSVCLSRLQAFSGYGKAYGDCCRPSSECDLTIVILKHQIKLSLPVVMNVQSTLEKATKFLIATVCAASLAPMIHTLEHKSVR